MAVTDGLLQALADELGLDFGEELVDRVLGLAALVAHATERKNAPVATFLAGQFVARSRAEGSTTEAALLKFRQHVHAHLPPDASAQAGDHS